MERDLLAVMPLLPSQKTKYFFVKAGWDISRVYLAFLTGTIRAV